MAVIRVQKTDNYVVMSNEHLRNKELSLKAKGLMSLMLSLPPQWDYSIGGLVAICKESHTSIRSAIKELEENRYLVRERKNNEKGYFVYEYTLYETQQPHTHNQHTAKKNADNTHTENRRQISKDEVSIDKSNIDKEKKDINRVLISYIDDNELFNLYKDYIQVREGMGVPLSEIGLVKLIERCERLSKNNIKVQKAILEAAIINNWKNVYLPRESELEAISADLRQEMIGFFGLDS